MMDRDAQLQLQSVFNDLAAAKDRIEMLENEAAIMRSEVREAVRRYDAIERLLESLAPGGSEFAGSPEACAEWVHRRLASVGKLGLERNTFRAAALSRARERNRYREQAEALATALAFYAYPPQDAERAADYYVADGGHKARRALALLKEEATE